MDVAGVIRTAKDVSLYMFSILPDAILPASAFYALITLSFAFFIFFVSLVEARLILWGLQAFTYHNFPNMAGAGAEPAGFYCANTITHTTRNRRDFFSLPNEPAFPRSPIYMMSVASAYVFGTIQNQSKELELLGPAFSSRYYVSLTLLLLTLLSVCIFRYMYECSTLQEIAGSSAIGLIVGGMLVMLNKRLFGDSSINMLGIPFLRNRTASGKKLYVCPK